MDQQAMRIYLDNAATTFPKPEVVYEAANTFYRTRGANANRGHNAWARGASQVIENTRQLVAEYLGARSADHVVFQPSSTIALNLAILGSRLRAGQVAYVSSFDHNSVLRPLEHLRSSVGIRMRELPYDRRSLAVDIERAVAHFRDEPPDLVAVCHASNVCGSLQPIEALARAARAVNPDVIVVVDGSQVAGLYPVDLKAGLIDFYIFSGHKALYGPYGASGLVFGTQRRPDPIIFGGTGTFSESLEMPIRSVSGYEAGSQNVWAVAGLQAAVHWLEEVGRDKVRAHAEKLGALLEQRLTSMPGVSTYTSSVARAPIVSITVQGSSPQAVEAALSAQGIAVRAGLHCAPWAHRVIDTLQRGGTIRFSPGYFNTSADIDIVCSTIEQLVAGTEY